MDNDINTIFPVLFIRNYYPWLWVMDDDMEVYTNAGLGGMSGQQLAGFYQWKNPVCSLQSPDDWEHTNIAVTNVVVDQVNEFPMIPRTKE
ncbi:MAG: hypothetical protein ACLU4J_01495 [Butyricimonas paravirosa]